jgi:hypothetical protein
MLNAQNLSFNDNEMVNVAGRDQIINFIPSYNGGESYPLMKF